jgi:hypothetical protein
MKVLAIHSLFSEELLTQLPINYRFMVKTDASTFAENYEGRRFSRSARHHSQAYIGTAPGKPVSNLVLQDYL